MLYLEDYLEMIEHLPQELRDRFTEMRELDLAVQNNMDSLDKKAHLFFKQCKRDELQHESMDTEFHSLRGEYFKVMEDADEKVAIATQIHELVERYLRRLDSELFKFKCELEADNNGITEILERRSLELDGNSTAATALLLSMNQKENRYYGGNSSANSLVNSSSTGHSSSAATGPSSAAISLVSGAAVGVASLSSISGSGQLSSSQRHRKLEKRRETICTVPVQEKRANLNHSLPVVNSGAAAGSVSSSSSAGGPVGAAVAGHVASAQAQASASHIGSIAATHLSLPVAVAGGSGSLVGGSLTSAAGSLVRQLPTNLAHSVLSSSGGGGTAGGATPTAGNATPVVTTGHAHSSGGAGGGATVTYNLQQLGGGAAASSAIAAAASQAIVATQQMQQGRRTASLKASYEAIHGTAGTTAEFWSQAGQSGLQPAAAGSVTVSAGTALTSGTSSGSHHGSQHSQSHHSSHSHSHTHGHGHGHGHHSGSSGSSHHQEKKQKKKLTLPTVQPTTAGGSSSGNSMGSASSSSMSVESHSVGKLTTTAMAMAAAAASGSTYMSVGGQTLVAMGTAAGGGGLTEGGSTDVPAGMIAMNLPSATVAPGSSLTIGENGLVVEQTNEGEWSYDPNEPRYCTCNQVSYGDMVACDNDACPYEWFHYPCVGITQPPKGKWYCPKCTASMRRRGNRKN
ncbi:inhibitor of growth protein 3 [Drosophila takahashii]|uniref:inhibitor of growth protein 3 n=1 Tax=Drosophila takahashii TaxID=29030 RepID=UPI001CF8E7F0|nr:inhibitor of growth protein 3 [Drosophila takahashii]